jgi:hypothetical protein
MLSLVLFDARVPTVTIVLPTCCTVTGNVICRPITLCDQRLCRGDKHPWISVAATAGGGLIRLSAIHATFAFVDSLES